MSSDRVRFWLIGEVFDNLQKVLSFLTRLVKEVEMFDYEFYKRLRTVKSALNSNDEVILRTIYDDLSCRLRSRPEVSTEEHSRAIRSSSSFLAQTINLFKCMKRKELGLVLL